MEHLAIGPVVVSVLIVAIPIIMIIGGIASGILRTRGRQRLEELVMRERIAAIERGIDPSKLSPLPIVDEHAQRAAAIKQLMATSRPTELQKAQGFLITGTIILAAGLGLTLMFMILPGANATRTWAAGLVPILTGLGLIVCWAIVRRGASENERSPGPPGV